ncbi:hypothetical protein C0Q70_17916 [Pomacea canaliculata]|uniref:Uncharacterized protein n=1 Tax=Pomacea canaliculata TaxID=400727 RepID=A0A2T7NLR7_POMCA|nr:hypothetical protein C0Q70_17916 [Pomacea canaliculata]
MANIKKFFVPHVSLKVQVCKRGGTIMNSEEIARKKTNFLLRGARTGHNAGIHHVGYCKSHPVHRYPQSIKRTSSGNHHKGLIESRGHPRLKLTRMLRTKQQQVQTWGSPSMHDFSEASCGSSLSTFNPKPRRGVRSELLILFTPQVHPDPGTIGTSFHTIWLPRDSPGGGGEGPACGRKGEQERRQGHGSYKRATSPCGCR